METNKQTSDYRLAFLLIIAANIDTFRQESGLEWNHFEEKLRELLDSIQTNKGDSSRIFDKIIRLALSSPRDSFAKLCLAEARKVSGFQDDTADWTLKRQVNEQMYWIPSEAPINTNIRPSSLQEVVTQVLSALDEVQIENVIQRRRDVPVRPVEPAEISVPEPEVTCYFRADMDAEVVVKRATTLVVTISREMLKQITTELSVVESTTVRSDKKILVRVIPRTGFHVVDESEGQADVDVPPVNKPLELSFDVRATNNEGEGEIWILFRQEQISVAKLVLKPKVVKTRSSRAETVTAERKISDPKPLDKPLHQLWIEELKADDGFIYRYTIYSQGLEINRKFISKLIQGDREKYVAGLYKQIEDRWISSNRDIENFGEELRAFGADLFDELIPVDLQTILWERRHDFKSMQVISGEPFIPWELVHLRDPSRRGMPDETIFMAQLGLIRWLDGAGENGWPTDQIKIRDGRTRYVIPKYPHPDYKLPEAEKEADFLEDVLGALKVTPESGEVRKLLAKPGGFDLLHFACHGVAESGSINEASLLMQGRVEGTSYVPDYLNAMIVAKYSDLKAADNEPIVVLNACQAGRAGYKLTGIGGFADAFLMGGAGAFVGTLWSVGDSPARTFTETLYKALLQGKNLSEATVDARTAAKAAGEATWLAYVVYGHPYLKISR